MRLQMNTPHKIVIRNIVRKEKNEDKKESIVEKIRLSAEVLGCISAFLVAINFIYKEYKAIISSEAYNIPIKYFINEDYRAMILIIFALIIFFIALKPLISNIDSLGIEAFNGVIFLYTLVIVIFLMQLLLVNEVYNKIEQILVEKKYVTKLIEVLFCNKINACIIITLIIVIIVISALMCLINKINGKKCKDSNVAKNIIISSIYIMAGYILAFIIICSVFVYSIEISKPQEKKFELIINNNGKNKCKNIDVDVVITEYDGRLVVMDGILKEDDAEKAVEGKSKEVKKEKVLVIYKYSTKNSKYSSTGAEVDGNEKEEENFIENDFNYRVIDRDDSQKFGFIEVDRVEFE